MCRWGAQGDQAFAAQGVAYVARSREATLRDLPGGCRGDTFLRRALDGRGHLVEGASARLGNARRTSRAREHRHPHAHDVRRGATSSFPVIFSILAATPHRWICGEHQRLHAATLRRCNPAGLCRRTIPRTAGIESAQLCAAGSSSSSSSWCRSKRSGRVRPPIAAMKRKVR